MQKFEAGGLFFPIILQGYDTDNKLNTMFLDDNKALFDSRLIECF